MPTNKRKYWFWVKLTGGVFLMPLLLYVLLLNSDFQTFTIKTLLSHLSKKYQVNIEIQKANINFFQSVHLEGLFIEGEKNDTLLFLQSIDIQLQNFSFSKKIIAIDSLKVQGLSFRIKSDSVQSNLNIFLDKVLGIEKDTLPSQNKWGLSVKTIRFSNSDFSLFFEDEVKDSVGMSFSDLKITKLNFLIDSIQLGDTISFSIKNLCLNEKSGFDIHELTAERCNIHNKAIELIKFRGRAAHSDLISDTLAVRYTKWADLKEFDEKAAFHFNLQDSSKTDLSDIAYFVPSLWGMKLPISVNWNCLGPANHLRISNLNLTFGNSTQIKGELKIKNLLDPINAVFDLKAKSLITEKADIENLYTQIMLSPQLVVFPDIVSKLGTVNFAGTFFGSIYNYDFGGVVSTVLGKLTPKLRIRPDSLDVFSLYQFHLGGTNFNLGKFISADSLIENSDFDLSAFGAFNSDSAFQSQYELTFSKIHINGYDLKNTEITGVLNNLVFTSKLIIGDENLSAQVFSKLNFSSNIPTYNFDVNLANAYLNPLLIDKTGANSSLRFNLSAGISADSIDNLQGKLVISNFNLWKANKQLVVDSFDIRLDENLLHEKKMDLKSNLVTAKVSGNFSLSNFLPSFQGFAHHFLPAVFDAPTGENVFIDENLFFDIQIKKLNNVFNYFDLEHKISEGSRFSGYYDGAFRDLTLNAKSDTLKIYNQTFSKLALNLHRKDEDLLLSLSTKTLKFGGLEFQKFQISSNLQADSLGVNFKWDNAPDTSIYRGKIKTFTTFSRKVSQQIPVIKLNIEPSTVAIGSLPWLIPACNVLIDSNLIKINNFSFFNQNQKIQINGNISSNPLDTLGLEIHNVNLNILNTILSSPYYRFGGIFNGNIKLNNVYNQPKVFTVDSILNLSLNKDTLGTLVVNSRWNNDLQKIETKSNLYKKNSKIGSKFNSMEILGDYYPYSNRLDYLVKLKNFPLSILNKPVEGIFSNISGRVSTDSLKIAGQLNNLDFKGFLKLQRANIRIDYLNTNYNFSDSVKITKNAFRFQNILLNDETGNTARLNGKITHRNFQNIELDMSVNASNFLLLNTTSKENELYYGTAKASGVTQIGGTPDNLSIKVSARTEKGTHFFIPLNSQSELSENKFLQFVIRDTTKTQQKIVDYSVDLSGFQLDFDLDVTPDADVQLIFDQKVGDILKGKGKGNIKLQINTLGEFNMYGDYTIEKGDYLFTLKNILNKKFEIEKGSSIVWDGDPYNAKLNILSSYKMKRIPLYDLLYDEEYKETRAPVNCNLIMTKELTKPTITFGVEIKGANDKIQEQLNALTSDEINKQFLSLLVINKFQPLPGINPIREKKSTEYTSGVSANASELLTNQLNHWLSQISPGVDIGVNYRATDSISRNQIEIALSKQLFNDRITLNGNINMNSQQNNTTGSNFTGEYEVEYKITKNGKLVVKYFGKPNENLIYETSAFKQGISLFYREEFGTFGELLKRYTSVFRKKKKELPN